MQIRALFFASYQDIAGTSSMEIELPAGSTVDDCGAALVERFPKFAQVLPNGRIAVNLEFVDGRHLLNGGDEVAFMPPMSGG